MAMASWRSSARPEFRKQPSGAGLGFWLRCSIHSFDCGFEFRDTSEEHTDADIGMFVFQHGGLGPGQSCPGTAPGASVFIRMPCLNATQK